MQHAYAFDYQGTVTTYYAYMGDKCVYQEEYTGTAQTKKTAYIYVGNQNPALCGRIAPQRQSAFITDSLRLCRRSQVKRGHDCRTLRAAIATEVYGSATDGALGTKNTGRAFCDEDPAKDGINWYVYCENNPLKYVDPDGLELFLPSDENGEWDREALALIEEMAPDAVRCAETGRITLTSNDPSGKSDAYLLIYEIMNSPEQVYIVDRKDASGYISPIIAFNIRTQRLEIALNHNFRKNNQKDSPAIMLLHELIHAHRRFNGFHSMNLLGPLAQRDIPRKDRNTLYEEFMTVGLYGYAYRFTENLFRSQINLPQRTSYNGW